MSIKRDCDGNKSKTQERKEFVNDFIDAWENAHVPPKLRLVPLSHPAAQYNYTRDLSAPPPPVDPRNLVNPDVYVPEHLRSSIVPEEEYSTPTQ